MYSHMFSIATLEFETNPFMELSTCITFEPLGKGRHGAIIVSPTKNDDSPDDSSYEPEHIPIVRTTTNLVKPSQYFKPIHHNIADKIKECFPSTMFNNAMVEIYTNEYRTMKFHSDLAMDLNPDSFIALFSCYNKPPKTCRKLLVINKETNVECSINLLPNSVVCFSVQANTQHLHKIILDGGNDADINWLGVTFRLSKTFVTYIPHPIFVDTYDSLKKANETETMEFYHMRHAENKHVNYVYSYIDYTISDGDMLPPT